MTVQEKIGTSPLRLWQQFEDIDPAFTKPITGKSYKGTSPNPQYVIRCLTEMFGPVGEGFGWDVVAEEFTPLGDEVLHWCRIRFWHGARENAFDAYGQTKALMKTRNGLMSDEDAPKKSLTDAIIKAASHLGVAANIFLGRWDDQKYVAEVAREYREAKEPTFDARAATDRILASIAKRTDTADLEALYRDERETVANIEGVDQAMKAEILAAFKARKAALTTDSEIPY